MTTPTQQQDVSQFEVETTPGQGGLGEASGAYWERIKGGDLGALPAVLGCVVLAIVFGILEPDSFLTEQNFANLLNQGAAIMVLAMGLVFVLLLGEIDLSAGFTAGTGAAILGVTLTEHGWAWPLSVLAALLAGVAIGLAIALLVARLGIPSFVVSLAFFLGLQGAMLLIIGEGGTIPIRNDAILAIMNKNMAVGLGWLFAIIVIGGFAAATFWAIRTRKRAGLPVPAMSVWAAKVVALGAVVVIAVFLLNQERQRPNAPIVIQGVPWVVPLVTALVVVLSFMLMRTSFGRHVYAVGGNAEAARRAGIGVPNVKTVCFILCSTLAVVAGILLASRDNSVSPTTGGAQTLLYAVGAAVIGGTSLFGGRGKIYDAITGGLVVAIIANGLPLVTQKSGIQYIINGLVLLLAASVDAISREKGGSDRQMTRWGILSTARIAQRSIDGARVSQDAEIVAVGSRDITRAQAYASEHGIERVHGSYEELLADPEVDAVYIPLPNSMHVPWSVRALDAGKHVLCEKPLSRDPARVAEAFDAAERNQRVLMEAFMWRFHPQTDELLRLVREGAVGELRVVRTAFGFGGISGTENVRLQTALEGGALMDVGCYCVSALRLLCGEPVRVSGEQVLGGDGGIDIRFAGTLRFEGDVLGTFDCGMDVHRRHSIEVVGSEGTILVPSPWQTPSGTEILLIRDDTERLEPELVDPYGRELDEVGAAIAEGRSPRLGRDESLGQARVIEALYRAAGEGVAISM